MRCAIYSRVSTRDKGQDTENQSFQLRQFAVTQGWEIYREFVDEKSGGTSDRDEFQALFHDASQRKFDVVLFWSLDRFSREGVVETLGHLSRLSGYGIGFRSLTEQYLDSTGIWRDAIIGILATIARQERIRLSERVRAGLDRARRVGKKLGGPRCVVDVEKVRSLRAAGLSWDAIGVQTGTSARTCKRRFAGLV